MIPVWPQRVICNINDESDEALTSRAATTRPAPLLLQRGRTAPPKGIPLAGGALSRISNPLIMDSRSLVGPTFGKLLWSGAEMVSPTAFQPLLSRPSQDSLSFPL